jgi:hypothetical protein
MLVYEILVVPNLDQWKEVPNFWWMISLSPILIVAVWAGYVSKYIKEIALIAVIGGVVRVGSDYWKATNNSPGYLKHGLADDVLATFLLHAPINSLLLFFVLLIGWWGAKIKNKLSS